MNPTQIPCKRFQDRSYNLIEKLQFLQLYNKTSLNTQSQTTTWPLLVRVVVMVQLGSVCSPVVVAVLSKALVL